MRTSDLLLAAHHVLSEDGTWVKGAYARNAQGDTVAPYDMDACQWCAYGVLERVCGGIPPRRVVLALRRAMGGEYVSIPSWNDSPERTRDEVLAVFRVAADLAEREGI